MYVILGKHIWTENSIFNTPKLSNFALLHLQIMKSSIISSIMEFENRP